MSLTLALLASLLSAPFAPAPRVENDSIRSDAEIRASVLRHADDVRRCYETEGLKRNPSLEGMLEIEVTILPTGVVEHVEASTPKLKGTGAKEVAKCLAIAAKNWRFDRGPYVVETVILPFNLRPTAAPIGGTGRSARAPKEPRTTGPQTTISVR